MSHSIELEVRAEINHTDFEKYKQVFAGRGNFMSHTRRISVMFFSSIGQDNFDIRVRVTDGKAEVVIKKGSFHSHDRIEAAQKIAPEELVGLARIFTVFGFESKVGERETYNYDFGNGIIVSLVRGGSVAYVEFEKTAPGENIEKEKERLVNMMRELGLTVIETEEQYASLGQKFTDLVDWKFTGTEADAVRLQEQVASMTA